jgi:hypothetical protein
MTTMQDPKNRRECRAWIRMARVLALSVCYPGALLAQGGSAGLQGIVFDSTEMVPLSGARVAVLGTNVMGDADELGRFRLADIPVGSHWVSFFHPRLQALGVSPPSRQITFEEGRTVQVHLAVPSERTLLMGWCMAEQQGEDVGAVAGVVADSLTGVPLSGALVTVTPSRRIPGEPRSLEVRADNQGYYRLCNVPAGREMKLQAHFGMNSGRSQVLWVDSHGARTQDLVLFMSAEGTLVGKVLEAGTNEPLEGAVISVMGTDGRQVTDPDGKFVLDGLPPGRHLVVTEYLGYEARTDSVTIFSQETVDIEVRMAEQALEIEGLVVTARTRFGRTSLAGDAKRADYMTRAEIEPMLARVQNAGDLLRNMNTPGLRIREVYLADEVTGVVVPGLCVEVSRRSGGEGCMQAAVFVNDVIMPSGADFLRDLDPNIIESIEILSPIDAQFQFGTVAGNGAILIYTR